MGRDSRARPSSAGLRGTWRDLSPLAAIRQERGAILIELALVALVLSLILAGTVELGRAVLAGQVIQDAARVAARELALAPLRAADTFELALDDPDVRSQVFDRCLLVIDLDAIPGGMTLEQYFGMLPVVNRTLRGAMIFDSPGSNGAPRRLLRYPGALIVGSDCPSGLTVAIPVVTGRDGQGVETVEWRKVIEEVRGDCGDPMKGPFMAAPPPPPVGPPDDAPRGVAAVRINYPYQAAMLSGFLPSSQGPFEPNVANVITADDAGVSASDPCSVLPAPIADDRAAAPYAGQFGLGRQLAFGQVVRPFRKLLSAQAVFRREVFSE